MAEDIPVTHEQLVRSLRQHLSSLEAAGISWLPTARTPLEIAAPATSQPDAHPIEKPPEDVNDPAYRVRELTVLAERVAGCTRCAELASTRTQTVFGVGRPDAPLCLVGEAPGADEDALGEPFVGAAGQMLNRIITAMGFRREDLYICNILKCRPPRNRQPAQEEADHCREYLERQLQLVRPQFICCLGGTAAKYLLGTGKSVGALRGTIHRFKDIPVVVTYHPAYLLLGHRSTSEAEIRERKKLVWDDMKLILTSLGRSYDKKPQTE